VEIAGGFLVTAFAGVREVGWEGWWEGASDARHMVSGVGDSSYDFFVYLKDPEFETRNGVLS
jgi:hypothetical protein